MLDLFINPANILAQRANAEQLQSADQQNHAVVPRARDDQLVDDELNHRGDKGRNHLDHKTVKAQHRREDVEAGRRKQGRDLADQIVFNESSK